MWFIGAVKLSDTRRCCAFYNSFVGPLILGIETSCDETAAAVVAAGRSILSNVVLSQVPVHQIYGGVVPELASREHLRGIVPVVRKALNDAGKPLTDLDAVAVTNGPGLVGALLVGLTYAKSLAMAAGKPLLSVNHLEGHVHAVLLEQRQRGLPDPEFPALTLVVSGGHTSLYEVSRKGERFSYRTLGKTRDDAAGEAYDKVAKLLGLGYPGGPIIDKLAPFGREDAAHFGRTRLKGNELDFSFSGIKTAVLRYVQTHDMQPSIEKRRKVMSDLEKPSIDDWRAHCDRQTLDLVASFQRAVVDELVERVAAASELIAPASIFVSGGVAANSRLRRALEEEGGRLGAPVYAPSLKLCTDNAAMIAAAAYPHFVAGEFSRYDEPAFAQLPL
jgi:N6-L-threonylcarbamoyladenine synthase